MDSGVAIQFGILIILLLLSAFFSSAETALTTINKIKIKGLADQGDKRAKNILKVTENSGKMLSAILIGNNIVNLSAASLMTTVALNLFGSGAIAIASGLLTVLVLIFGEITPKTLATIHAEKIALVYAGIILILMKVLTPVIFIINSLSMLVLKLLRADSASNLNTMTEHELRTIVDVGLEEGVIETEERQMIHNVFDFGDSQAKDVMVPRVDMVFIDVDSTYDEVAEVFKRDKFTRLPVYENSTDNVIGVINIKDVFFSGTDTDFSVRSLMRETHFTYEYKKTSELMMEMRQDAINFTIVLDEYGATAGLITLEDLLEEIVGEIRDEYDHDEEELLQQINDCEIIVEGSFKLDDLNDALGLELTSEDYDSVGGYIIERLDHLPEKGEFIIDDNGIRMVVDCVTKNRIDKVHLYLPEPAAAVQDETADSSD